MVPHTLTNVSGVVAVAATSTSKGIDVVMQHAPIDATSLYTAANHVISIADIVGICSVSVLTLSFIYNVISSRKKHRDTLAQLAIDRQFYQLRQAELELEQAKFNKELLE